MSYGVRYSMFYRMGSQNINLYTNNQAVTFNNDLKIYEEATPVGTKHYGSGDVKGRQAIKEVIARMPNPKPVAGKRAGAARHNISAYTGGKNPAW